MRYVLGPAVGPFTVQPTAPVPGALVDLAGTITAHDDNGVTINFVAFDPAASQPAAEIKLFLVPEGHPVFATVDEFLASTYAVTTHANTPDPAGHDVIVPKPEVPAGSYVGQVVFGYAV